MITNSSVDLWTIRQRIAQRTTEGYADLVVVVDSAISFLIDTVATLEGFYKVTEHHTAEGASQAASWRFLSTLPTSVSWCYYIALRGDYGIAKNLLRLSLEEAVKLSYYVAFPDRASKANSTRQ